MTVSFQIGDVHLSTAHLAADLIEIMSALCFFGRNYVHKNDFEQLLVSGSRSLDEGIDSDSADSGDENEGVSDAESHSDNDRSIDLIWEQLEYRSNAFGDFYPFVMGGDRIYFCENLSAKMRLYILLLACSRLRSFKSKGLSQRWAKIYAFVCNQAMRGLLPAVASARIFDANSEDRHEYYGKNLRHALRKLGNDLGAFSINEGLIDEQSSSGDAGLDIVGTLAFNDGAPGHLVIMGQCGAQEKGWTEKTLESHPDAFRHLFNMPIPWASVMFTPVCYRRSSGVWHNSRYASGALLLDRLRILKLLANENVCELLVESKYVGNFEKEFKSVKVDM